MYSNRTWDMALAFYRHIDESIYSVLGTHNIIYIMSPCRLMFAIRPTR